MNHEPGDWVMGGVVQLGVQQEHRGMVREGEDPTERALRPPHARFPAGAHQS
jgi:hypothetical protein